MLDSVLSSHYLLIMSVQKSFSSEQTVNVFKLKPLCFGEENKDNRNPSSVENGEDDVRSPSDVVDGDGCDLYNHLGDKLSLNALTMGPGLEFTYIVEDPVHSRRDCGTFLS